MINLSVAAAIGVISYFGWRVTARSGYESAEYTVLETAGQFETREYPELMLATTRMQFQSQGDDGSFMRLFRYISGANDASQEIAMTTPVFMDSAAHDDLSEMAFVIPREIAGEQVPEPTDERVRIGERAGGQFAVIRFAGRINQESFGDAELRLRRWMDDEGLVGDGVATSAGYDPPWTPGPLRRNEVLIRLK